MTGRLVLFMAAVVRVTGQQTTAFVGPVGFLPKRVHTSTLKSGSGQQAALPPTLGNSAKAESSPGLFHYGQAALAACLCGFAASLVGRMRQAPYQLRFRVARADGARVTALDPPARSTLAATATPTLAKKESLDDVETSVSEVVPKIAALQSQAELLRKGELRKVIHTMKSLRKTELRGVFSEVDQLLCALIGAIDGLRESAQTIRKSELRQHFEQMDRDAKSWVGKIEKDAVESLTGYRAEKQEAVETMMEVHVVGLSHHKAPVDVREKLAVAERDWNKFAQELVQFAETSQGFIVPEVGVLSTCNRFELYFASSEMKKFLAIESVHAFLRQKSGLSKEELAPYLFTHSGEEATQHLFEVSSGLDSLVLGEAQILAQVKACHEHCIEKADPNVEDSVAGHGGKIIAKMLNAGIRIGKVVRTKTKIGKGSVSVSSAAVELMMQRAMPDLRKYSNKLHVCIVGAGKMARLLCIALFSKQPDIQLTLVNRSTEKAQALLDEDLVKARGGANAKVAPMDEMMDVLRQSDVVFAATGSKDPIITAADLEGLDRRNLMLVDISVPRNIAADCGDVDGAFSYSVDDLKTIVQANAEKRQNEVLKAKRLIFDHVKNFKLWQASQGAVPYLAALQSMAEGIREAETKKMEAKLKGLHEKERQTVDKLTRHIVDQLFRPIYYSMKEEEGLDAKKNKILALARIFGLEPKYKRRLLPGGAAPQLNA